MIQEEDHPFSYNIEEIFGAFTFNLCRKKVSRKRVRKVKQIDETMEEMQEDEVLSEKNDEAPMTIAITSNTITQATAHNIIFLNDKPFEIES